MNYIVIQIKFSGVHVNCEIYIMNVFEIVVLQRKLLSLLQRKVHHIHKQKNSSKYVCTRNCRYNSI